MLTTHEPQQFTKSQWRESFNDLHQSLTLTESQQLIYQLQARRIDLELKIHTLLEKRDQLEQRLERYSDLYHFAPIGYVTLTYDGVIQEINLTAAKLLGLSHNRLIKQPFKRFVSPETQSVFHVFLNRMIDGVSEEHCEIVLISEGASPCHMRLDGVGLGSTGGWLCHVVMSDMTGYKQAARHRMETAL
jgi:PAS domain-containing protein